MSKISEAATTPMIPSGEDPLPADAVERLLQGSKEPRYTPGSQVGAGGMGEVVLAEDRVLGRQVALKRLHVSEVATPDAVLRFLREARVTGRLEHPNIMDVYDLGVDDAGRPYYTMPYLGGGETLEAVIDRLRAGDGPTHATFTMQRRAQIAQQLCQALRYAHERGVLHLDIKPTNVMLGPFGEVVLLDWGLVRLQDPSGGTEPESMDDVHGTLGYMSPEQLTGQASPASDVYMLCATLYELFSLHHYLGLDDAEQPEIAYAVMRAAHVSADTHVDPFNGRVPRDLARLCEAGLVKDVDDRTQRVEEVEAALQLYLERMSPVMCPTTLSLRVLSRWQAFLIRHPGPATALTLLGLGLFPLALICLGAVVFGLV